MFRTSILKVTSFCNLNCDYCYMFNLGDQTHRLVPKYMSIETLDQVLDRIEEHVSRLGGPFLIALHGGEPTLWPISHFDHLARRIEIMRGQGLAIELSLQTNLLLPLSDDLRAILRRLGAKLGVSIDGPPEWNDRHRVDHAGRGSALKVMRNVDAMIREGDEDLIGGFLSVIDPAIPPEEFLGWADSLPVRRLDVLWPIEFSQDNPPWGSGNDLRGAYARAPRYGNWMAALFRLWWERDDPSLHIRQFLSTIGVLLGGQAHIDSLVNDRVDMLVVNTDGRIEYPDYLRATAAGSRPTGMSVYSHGFDMVAADPVFSRLLKLGDALPDACRNCRHEKICGGGFLPGRTSADAALAPTESVLCYDQKFYFDAVANTLSQRLAASASPAATVAA